MKARIPIRAAGGMRAGVNRSRRPRFEGILLASVPAALVTVAALWTVVGASSSVTFLGKPSNSLPRSSGPPYAGFRRSSLSTTLNGKPELIFIGTLEDDASAAERWPVVKALDQFGTLSGVAAGSPGGNGTPTFDWLHSVYHSHYLTFAHLDVLDSHGKLLQRPSGLELTLYKLYSRPPKTRSFFEPDPYHFKAAVAGLDSLARRLPLLAIEKYVQTVSRDLQEGDFKQPIMPPGTPSPGTQAVLQPISFTQAHDALVRGRDPSPDMTMVEDVNAEANVITALICRADGGKPASVCGRPVIKTILKSVK